MTALALPVSATAAILDDVRSHGTRRVESGGFLLAAPGAPDTLAIVALAGERGVSRSWGLFEISGAALGRLFDWASERELTIRAQVHSHARDAFLSRTDLEHGFTVEGFTTTVVPWFADPPGDPNRWGWWRCSDGRWEQAEAPRPSEGQASVARFDEDGVRES